MNRFWASVKRISNDRPLIRPTVVVHAGAEDHSDNVSEVARESVNVAAFVGYDVLSQTGSVVSAVHEAVRLLEVYSCFNPIRITNLLTEMNSVELQASIMRGIDLNCGSVSGVKDIFHPISLASLIMEKTQHKILVREKAIQFAVENHFDFKPCEHLVYSDILPKFDEHKSRIPKTTSTFGSPIGAVAIDFAGNIAAANSGSNIGGGIYADNANGGVSVSCEGEEIQNHNIASRILAKILCQQLSAEEATKSVLENLYKRLGKTAGAVCIDVDGSIGIHFTSRYMPWAFRINDQFHSGMEKDDHQIKIIESNPNS